MPKEPPHQQPAAKRGSRLQRFLIAAVVLLPLALLLYITFGPNPPIVVSKATTHLTTPLAADGLPDYAAALLAEMRKGVTPENNAAVPFLEAMWPADSTGLDSAYTDWDLSNEDIELLCKELGLAGPPPPGKRYQKFETPENRLAVLRWLRDPRSGPKTAQLTAGWQSPPAMTEQEFLSAPEEQALLDDRVTEALWTLNGAPRPWTREEAPPYADWIDRCSPQLDAVVKGLKRPEWYLPSASLLRGDRKTLSSGWMWQVMQPREAMRTLSSRAKLYSGEGRHDDAVGDLLAILMLSKHLSAEPTLIERTVANAIENVAFHNVHRLVTSPGISESTLRRLLAELDRIGPREPILPGALKAERLIGLGYTIDYSLHGIEEEVEPDDELLGDYVSPMSRVRGIANRFSIDWNAVLIEINQHYDQVEAALRLPTRSQVEASLLAAEQRHVEAEATLTNQWDYLKHGVTPQSRGRLVACACLLNLSGGYGSYLAMDDRNRVQRGLARLHLALAIHRAQHGGYPDTLDQLVPNAIAELPTDPINTKPYAYRMIKGGFLLYSLGPNGIDDGGSRGVDDQFSYSERVYEGVEIDSMLDPSTNTLTPAEQAAYDLLDKIPPGADDIPLRIPLPVEPWPGEE